MNLLCQQEALENIKLLAEHDQHGVLIVGNSGGGKTYVARQYAKFLRIGDFYTINPAVSDLRNTIDSCVAEGTKVVLCIENLDSGVVQASYPLLKLIEDCPKYIYVVVTCNNIAAIPDTIPSRCAVVTVNPPTKFDLEQYAKSQDQDAYTNLSKTKLWDCASTLTDVNSILRFTPEQLRYYANLSNLKFNDSVSNISWKLQHYEDNSPTPVELVVRYLFETLGSNKRKACIECLNDLAANRISKNAILSKLVFELKYVN